MSMFFTIWGHGLFDKEARLWDDGITSIREPKHASRHDIDIYVRDLKGIKVPNTDKASCEQVQELGLFEKNGGRSVLMLVKAMGYAEAVERARDFCDKWYKPKQTSKKQAYTRKDMNSDQGRNARSGSYDSFFEQR